MSERLRAWGSCGGLLAVIFVTAVIGLIAYRIDQASQGPARVPEEKRVQLRLTGTLVQVYSDADPPVLVAEIEATTIEVNRDQTVTEIDDIHAVRIYREGELYLAGRASHATHDQQAQELRVRDGIQLAHIDGRLEMSTDELVYYTDTQLLVATRPVTAVMGDATLKTPTARVNVGTQTFQAPRKVAVTTTKQGTMVADSASGDIDAQRLSLISNVIMNATVGELRKAAEEAGRETGQLDVKRISDETRVRIRTGRADFDFVNNQVSATGRVALVTEEGSVMSETADVTEKTVVLAGGVTITMRGGEASGPVTVETATARYDIEEDLATCPSPVTARVREGSFRANTAQARLRKGSWRLVGNVKGTIDLGVL